MRAIDFETIDSDKEDQTDDLILQDKFFEEKEQNPDINLENTLELSKNINIENTQEFDVVNNNE